MKGNAKETARIAVTGTPGVGKTTVARRLAEELGAEYFDVTEAVCEGASSGYDDGRGVPVADIEALRDAVPDEGDEGVIMDGHLTHQLEPDAVVVLRCCPEVLRERLVERGWDDEKVRENVESETLDVVLAEAVGTDAPVYEFDTTDESPDETVERVVRALEDGDERVGVVDWFESMDEGVRS